MSELSRETQKRQNQMSKKSHIDKVTNSLSPEHLNDDTAQGSFVGETPFQPPVMTHLEMISGATSVEEKTRVMSHLQRSYGNNYVQRLLKSGMMQTKLDIRSPYNTMELKADNSYAVITPNTVAVIQRAEGEDEDIYADLEPSTEVPDLTRGTVNQVRTAMVNARLQDAIDLILAEVKESKMPNLSNCNPSNMEYDPTERAAGHTSCAYYPDDNTVDSIRVTIGNKAFATVSYLYSTMMHEYEHVNQYLVDPKGSVANPGIGDFMAYTWEIYHAQETGLINQSDKLTYRGGLMKTMGFDKMSALEQDENMEVYEHAVEIIQDAIGDPSWQP